MDKPGIINLCKELGCCDACCLRFIGLKNPKIYESPGDVVLKFQSAKNIDDSQKTIEELKSEDQICRDDETNQNQNGIADDIAKNEAKDFTSFGVNNKNGDCADVKHSQPDVLKDNSIALNKISTEDSSNKIVQENSKDSESPPAKRCKLNVCASCLGVLQEDLWAESFTTVKEVLDKKGYECTTFACGLSSPIAIILREKVIVLRIVNKFPGFDGNNVTPLKEAWKWSFATRMAANINKVLDSGAVSPLLITLNYDYPDDLQELEILKTISPKLFQTRSQQRRRYTTEFTRRSVEQALENVTLPSMVEAGGGLPLASATAKCVSVVCTHSPIYLAGRYLKLSRNLPQTPWVLEGRRVLPSSVQEIIFKPIADIYKFTQEESEQRLKFVAAGREDVDVRCLGEGRPFAIEITDPRRQLTAEELARACEEIEKSGEVVVKSMVPIEREDLTELKKGEETKSKTYEAICIKLTHSKYDDVSPDAPIRVTKEDLQRINEFRNTPEGDPIKIKITQKTPIRVLHRRPLLTRTRGILELNAYEVPEHQHLFRIVATTTAGTYVKEWACGELGRTAPALPAVLTARAALLALDVAAVTLRWPPRAPST